MSLCARMCVRVSVCERVRACEYLPQDAVVCGYSAGTLRVLCGYSAGTLRVLCSYSAGTLQLLCGYSAATLRVLCEYLPQDAVVCVTNLQWLLRALYGVCVRACVCVRVCVCE